MKLKRLNSTSWRMLAIASCLFLAIGRQARSQPQVQQPPAVAAAAAPNETPLAHDQAVEPADCTDPGGGGCGCDSGRGSSCCGQGCCCEPVCCPKRVSEEVKKHCWKVSTEMICIPGFRFECNWKRRGQGKSGGDCGDTCCAAGTCCDCGPPTCGRVRCINVLEKHEYTCDKCGYEWEVKCVRSSKNGCCQGSGCGSCPSCGRSGCCASTDPVETDVQLTSATAETTPTAAEKPDQPAVDRRFMSWLK